MLGKNEQALFPAIQEFNSLIHRESYIEDLKGERTVEILGSKFLFDPTQKTLNFGVRKTNEEYVKRELDWYKSQSLSIHPAMSDIKVWKDMADENGNINSNYGHLIFSAENGRQYEHCVNKLIENRNTKRAVMIYTRPSIWTECEEQGSKDFICTDGVQCSIRGDALIYMVKQRSCDLIYGMFNDLAWHQWVFQYMVRELRKRYRITKGTIMYFPFNLQVYEKHFKALQGMYDYCIEELTGGKA